MLRKTTAFITGASSGIGAAFARKLAAQGYDVLLQGRRESLLAELCATLRKEHGIEAGYLLAELSSASDLESLEARIRSLENLEILVNNAGFGGQQPFQREDIDRAEEMIRVHIVASVRLAHAALPVMQRRRRGAIINVSSVAAFFVSPMNNTYCASKLYLNSFSESLALEVKKQGITVQALCPGFTTTDFHRRAGIDPEKEIGLKFMRPDVVVDSSLRALRQKQVICIPGFKYKFAVLASRLIPRPLLYRLVVMFQGREPAET